MKRVLAILMAALTLITMSLTTAFAKSATSYKGKSLVIIGDSISAGFGLANAPEDTLTQVALMPHGEWVDGSNSCGSWTLLMSRSSVSRRMLMTCMSVAS